MTNDIKIRKLSTSDVYEIRSLLRQKNNMLDYIAKELSTKAIAEKFGISKRYVLEIGSNKHWSHLPE